MSLIIQLICLIGMYMLISFGIRCTWLKPFKS